MEGALQEVAVEVGKVSIKQDDLTGLIGSGFQRLEASLNKVYGRTEDLTSSHQNLQDRLEPLEAQQVISKERKGILKSVWVGVLLAAAGGLATKGGEFLWSLLAHK